MYIVYVLAIRDVDAVEANSAAPIEEIINQQVGPVVTKIIVAVALTNILACLLANILVATRLTYSMARDNMLPFSHVWRHVSANDADADLRRCSASAACRPCCCCRRWSTRRRSTYIIGIASLLFFFVYILQTIGLLVGVRRGTIPAARARHLRPRPVADAALHHRRWSCSSASPSPWSSCRSSPATTGSSSASSRSPRLWWATGLRARLRRGDAGVDYAKTHLN